MTYTYWLPFESTYEHNKERKKHCVSFEWKEGISIRIIILYAHTQTYLNIKFMNQ